MTFNQLITRGARVTDVFFLLQTSFLPRGDLFASSPGSNTLSETFDAIAKSGGLTHTHKHKHTHKGETKGKEERHFTTTVSFTLANASNLL